MGSPGDIPPNNVVPLHPDRSPAPRQPEWPIETLREELLRFAVTLTADRPTAEDLVQRALLRSLDVDRSAILEPIAWLKRVARNAFYDQRRREGTRERLAPEAALAPTQPAADRADARRDLGAALRALPPEWSQAIVLVSIEGWSYAEVAELQRVPEGTVKSRISRARQRLAAHLRAGRGAGESDPCHRASLADSEASR
jgi:RNA polymerase sigma-70 factor (ECF subfamily)